MVAAAGSRVRARLLAGVLLLVWLAVAGVGGPLVGQLTSVQNNDQASFLPDDAESTQVAVRLGEFGADTTLPLLLVVEDESGVDRATIGELQGWAKQLPQQSIEDVPGTVGETLSKIVPSNAGEAMMSVTSRDSLLSPMVGLAVLVAWVVGLLTLAAVALRRRDA